MDNKFTWIPFYKELSDWLLEKQNSQPELISTLKDIGITGFRDGTEKGKEITLQEIDPFTFLAYLNKFHSDEKRVEILQDLRHKLNFSCPEPTDVSGIPTTHPMKVHLFPWKTIRGNNDINVLWELFGQVKEGKVDVNALFDALCKLSNKSKNTFTQFLAYHYNFDYDLQDVGDRYKADVPCLLKLKDLVCNEISISKGVDKLAFIRLKDALLEAIRRCEGKSDTLPPM